MAPKEKLDPSSEVLNNLPDPEPDADDKTSGRATMEQYTAMMADRPAKFTAEQVNYRDGENIEQRCGRCIHFFKNPWSSLATCEIFRPENDGNVDPTYICDLFTQDYKSFPLMKGSAKEKKGDLYT